MTTAAAPWWHEGLLDEFTTSGPDGPRPSPADLERARRHGVELMTLDAVAARVGLGHDLDQYRHTVAAVDRVRRLQSVQAIAEIESVLDEPVIVIKGPAIAYRWYDDPDHRPFGDIDLLVGRERFVPTLLALEREGGEILLENWRGFLRHGIAEVPVRWADQVIDLHWDIVASAATRRSIRFDIDRMIQRTVPLELPGVRVRTLDDIDTLLHACVNFGLGGARRWGHLVDVGLIAGRGAIDVDELTSRARSTGAGALTSAVLRRSAALAGSPIDPDWHGSLEPWRGWLWSNRLVDRIPRPAHVDAAAPGRLLTSGRETVRATAATLATGLAASWQQRRGAPAPTAPGGDLNWNLRRPPSSTERTAYLGWVERGAGLRLIHDPPRHLLDEHFGPLEPRATPALGLARQIADGRVPGRVMGVADDDGTPVALMVTDDWGPLRRTGYPVLIDPVAARAIAEQIDVLGVTELAGFDTDLDPLRPLVRRWGPVTSATPVALPYGATWEPPPPSTRRARRHDLERITDLLWQHAAHGFVHRSQLRRRLRRSIDDLVIVAESGGTVTAVAVRESTTERYHYWSTILVDPAARGGGQSWDLIAAIVHEAFSVGAGAVGFGAASNPMPAPVDSLVGGTWQFVELRPPGRWPGERRLRSAVTTAEDLLGRRPDPDLEAHRDPGADDDHVTERRTQTWWNER